MAELTRLGETTAGIIRPDGSRRPLLRYDAMRGVEDPPCEEYGKVDWLIVGGESGPKARPCDMAWIRSAVEQCRAAGVACFVKQAAGLKPGDQLIAVNGENIEGLTPAETSTRVRGEPGTTVTLTLRRNGVADPLVKTMTRATIAIDWMRARILEGGIGYLQIRQFAIPDALPLFNKAMDQFAAANIRALIIDVRSNPGGSVATGEEIASRLMPDERPIYQQVDRRGERTVYTWGDYWKRDIPIAVLTNGGSGSMSEILAAALQENGLAKVIGTKTAGAVAAAIPSPLADGSGLLVTVQMINTPSGRVLNEVGLEPDMVVELDPDLFRIGRDTQLEAALGYVRDEIAARGRASLDAH